MICKGYALKARTITFSTRRAYTTVPKGIMATYILPLIELKFSVFQSDKWIHVFLLSDPPLPLPITFSVIVAFLGQPRILELNSSI